MADIRDKAKDILAVIPPPPREIRSSGDASAGYSKDLFTSLTGTSQETMQQNWSNGGIMTACNGFVGWYGRKLGADKYLGRFDLETYLPTIGKGYSWVKSTADVRPKYGDICRHTAFHIGVSLDFDGDVWNHVDAGQGGPKMGYDVLKRTRGSGTYNYKNLQGWIDIELYFGAAPQTRPIPGWLQGWWNVSWRGQTYYYYFSSDPKVQWTQTAPLSTSQPPALAKDTGTVTVENDGSITIRWGATGSVEKFSGGGQSMQGKWNDRELLSASKM